MNRAELASLLVQASYSEREILLRTDSRLADVELGRILKDICRESWGKNSLHTLGAADALRLLAEHLDDDGEVAALSAWASGIASLSQGQMERAIAHLDEAAERFTKLNLPHMAASTQVAKLYALAVLGRYDEAIECGLKAHEVLLAHGDQAGAGRIEHNIGNIYSRLDRYPEAEQFQLAARSRFIALGDEQQLAKIDNSLAMIRSKQYRFRSAEQLYEEALTLARRSHLIVTEAEIESTIGTFALFQGRYERALDFLERARRKYSELGRPHDSAISELEIADTYLELNLGPEAAEIYERVIQTFAELGMKAEQAHALARRGRALILLGQLENARRLLQEARALFINEGNSVALARVSLTEAQLHYEQGNYEEAFRAAGEAESSLASAGAIGSLLLARWLRGEAARKSGNNERAKDLLASTLEDAEELGQQQIGWRCYTSLGLLALASGERGVGEDYFKKAIALVEDLRAPLPAEEFRAAFFADKLTPYDELVRLCLMDGARDRSAEALEFVERSRSRALVDMLGGSFTALNEPRDGFEKRLLAELEELRQELSWFYNRINRPSSEDAKCGAEAMAEFQREVRKREAKTLEITRQLQHYSPDILPKVETLDVERLRRKLGHDTALIEYAMIDDNLLCFVVTDESVKVIRGLARKQDVTCVVEQFRFQINTLRYGVERMRQHLPRLTERARTHLQSLYELLLAPIVDSLGGRRLVIVPYGTLHYIPFHALHDGTSYIIEQREVSYAPSAIVLEHCLAREQVSMNRALLIGVADEATPRVREEIESLAPLFPEATVLLDEGATVGSLLGQASGADVIHLACHGQFRPDNPLFSSLRLSDGWLTVREASKINLSCGLMTLSACETGVSHVAPGDELLGLARAFLKAGAPSLLLSLWTVDDEATASLMRSFYERLRMGEGIAASLRYAQIERLRADAHPYFWSPFVLIGRW
jgi:CHAT domain-containing protein/tetratricopeptide (TPR) repeat protein